MVCKNTEEPELQELQHERWSGLEEEGRALFGGSRQWEGFKCEGKIGVSAVEKGSSMESQKLALPEGALREQRR